VPLAVTEDTLLCEYNDLAAARTLAERHANDLACVIVEPVAGNMGVVPPKSGFLEGLRAICNGTGAPGSSPSIVRAAASCASLGAVTVQPVASCASAPPNSTVTASFRWMRQSYRRWRS